MNLKYFVFILMLIAFVAMPIHGAYDPTTGSGQVVTNGVNTYSSTSTNYYTGGSKVVMGTNAFGMGAGNSILMIQDSVKTVADQGSAIFIKPVGNTPVSISMGHDVNNTAFYYNSATNVNFTASFDGVTGRELFINASGFYLRKSNTTFIQATGTAASPTIIHGSAATGINSVPIQTQTYANGANFNSGVLWLPSSTAGASTNGSLLSRGTASRVIGTFYTNGAFRSDATWGTIIAPAAGAQAKTQLYTISASGALTNIYESGDLTIPVAGTLIAVTVPCFGKLSPNDVYYFTNIVASGTQLITNFTTHVQ